MALTLDDIDGELARRTGAEAPPLASQGAPVAPAPTAGVGLTAADIDAELARRAGGAAPAAPGQAPQAEKQGGFVRNVEAGGNNFVSSLLGMPVDVMNAIGTPGALAAQWVGDKIIDPLLGRQSPTDAQKAEILAKTQMRGGSADIRKGMDALGIHTSEDTEPKDAIDRIGAGVGNAVPAFLGPHFAARSAIGETIGALNPYANAIVNAFAQGHAPAQIAMATGAGIGGPLAAEWAPERYKPLADFAGQVVGGGVGGALATGVEAAGRGAWNGVRNFFEPSSVGGRRQVVGRTLVENATDAAGLADKLADAAELVPGSKPTTAQASGDSRLLALERAVSRNHDAAFLDRAAEQSAARTSLVSGLAKDGADGNRVGQFLTGELGRITAEHDARIAQAAADASAKLEAMGGHLSPDQYGATIRSALDSAKQSEKKAVGKLYNAIDPDGKLALDISPLKQAAGEIRAGMPKSAEMAAEEARLHGVLESMPDVEAFRELTGLRSELTTAIRQERFSNGESPALKRMGDLLRSVDERIGGFMGEAGGAATEPAPAARTAGGSAPAVGSTVYTPSGRPLGIQYEVVEGASLKPAADEFQPRNRDRAASEAQIARMARELEPERLGAAPGLVEGAPVVTPDGMVLSGNGRTQAILRAHEAGGANTQAYRDWLASQGFDTSGMRAPVLVRRMVEDLPREDLVRIAQEANGPAGMAFSATERAKIDAGRTKASVLDLYQGGDITDAANRPFVKAWMATVPERNEVNGLATADGKLSLDGARRIQGALLHQAYGDSGLVAALTETGEENIRAFGRALTDAAPALAQLRSGVSSGSIAPSMDIAPSILEAARLVQTARSKGMPLADVLAQRDAFTPTDPFAERLLRIAYGEDLTGRISQQKLAEALQYFAQEASHQQAVSLFGEATAVAPMDILQVAGQRYGRAAAEGTASSGAGGVRAGHGTAGEGPGGPVAGSGRPEAPKGGAGHAQPGPLNLTEEALSPNYDAAAAARYREANARYRDYAETFKGGPVGAALAADKGGGYRVAESAVAGKFFNAGSSAKEDVDAFARAIGGNQQAVGSLLDYAASSLRSHAVKPDGTLDLGKWQAWLKRNGNALRAFDQLSGSAELRVKFQKAADAQSLVNSLGVAREQSLKDFQKSAARFWLNDEDPVQAVAKAFNGNSKVNFADLAKRVSKDPDAKEGLRRAVADFMLEHYRGNTQIGQDAERAWHPDKFQNFVAQHKAALRWVFTKEQMDGIEAVAADLQRAQRSTTGSKLPGGSDTMQNLHGAAKLPHGASVLEHVLSGAAGALGGALYAGPVGLVVGGTALELLQIGRTLGMQKAQKLLAEAMLNPALARELVLEVKPHARVDYGGRLLGQLQQLGIVSAGRVADR